MQLLSISVTSVHYIHVHALNLGVMHIGKEKALQFVSACKSQSVTQDIIDCFRQWREGSITEGANKDTCSGPCFHVCNL